MTVENMIEFLEDLVDEFPEVADMHIVKGMRVSGVDKCEMPVMAWYDFVTGEYEEFQDPKECNVVLI